MSREPFEPVYFPFVLTDMQGKKMYAASLTFPEKHTFGVIKKFFEPDKASVSESSAASTPVGYAASINSAKTDDQVWSNPLFFLPARLFLQFDPLSLH